MQDQTGFDGFTEADFIGEQYAWRIAVGHFMRDIKLMRDQAGTAADQAVKIRMAEAVESLQCLVTQLEPFMLIDLAIEQTLRGSVQLQKIIQFRFRHPMTVAGIIIADVS